MDWSAIGSWAGGAVAAVSAYVTGRHRERRSVVTQLDDCERRNSKLKARISALETEMVTLRKLLPGGEWFLRLGLDRDPGAPDR